MDIADWRKKIDEIDQHLVRLLNERAQAAQEIGKLKRNTSAPIYEPQREEQIFENVSKSNHGPLPDSELRNIYERIIAVMRDLQKVGIQPKSSSSAAHLEVDLKVNE